MKLFILLLISIALLGSCTQNISESQKTEMIIKEEHIDKTIQRIAEEKARVNSAEVERGVKHVASLWRVTDGTHEDFFTFCIENYIVDNSEKEAVFLRMSEYFESLFGSFNKIAVDLRKNVDLQTGPLHPVDHMFSAFSAGAHLTNDLYENKIAFLAALNFPFYSTEEKNELGSNWSELEWAYARMGDIFSSRVPSEINQKIAAASAEADAYIAEYNIHMGAISDENGKVLFPEDMVLLSHWNLRDEIKANYANHNNGFQKQAVIYKIMQRIIDQTIPEDIIN